VLNKLDYLKDLGVEVLYLNPIFVSPSNHKYDTQDYDYIDPHFTVIKKSGGELLEEGDHNNNHATRYMKKVTDIENLEASNEFFAYFVRKVHEKGMKVILDGVFNHCGSFNKWLDRERIYQDQEGYQKGAYIDEKSPYTNFFKFRESDWPYNKKYEGWWGHETLPKLNYEESEELFEYILSIGKKWVSPPYHADGWRLDVAADLGNSLEFNHYFWEEFRKAVKEANPEAIILAEHYGDATPWISGGEWDTVMNYDAFMEPLTWFLTGMEKHSDMSNNELYGNIEAFWDAMLKYSVRFTTGSLQAAMNELSNHDHSRFLTRTNRTIGRVSFMTPESAGENIRPSAMMAAVIFQMTWIGAPTVYYGDEVGVCGWTDPDNRRTYPWGRENKELLFCHKEMIRIHKDYDVLRTGSLIPLHSEYGLLSFGRFNRKDCFAIAVYIGNYEKEISLPVWKLGLSDDANMIRMAYSDDNGFSLMTDMVKVREGCIHLNMKPNSAFVYKIHEGSGYY
ncbi:MAG: glycoside hydrolase family 13 protein, partial [Lachnoclostridium sp.]|nr:glycoside hydrolase family 13 protein [Lachnoclostridium sp.]